MKLSILPLTHPVAVSPSLPHPEPISYSISPCPPSPLPRTSPLAARAPSRTRRAAAQGGPRARRAHCRRRPHRHLPGRRHAARLHPHRGLPRRAAVLRQGGGEVILKLVGRLGATIFVLEWAALALAFELRLDDRTTALYGGSAPAARATEGGRRVAAAGFPSRHRSPGVEGLCVIDHGLDLRSCLKPLHTGRGRWTRCVVSSPMSPPPPGPRRRPSSTRHQHVVGGRSMELRSIFCIWNRIFIFAF